MQSDNKALVTLNPSSVQGPVLLAEIYRKIYGKRLYDGLPVVARKSSSEVPHFVFQSFTAQIIAATITTMIISAEMSHTFNVRFVCVADNAASVFGGEVIGAIFGSDKIFFCDRLPEGPPAEAV